MIKEFVAARTNPANPEINKIDNSINDISDDWTETTKKWLDLVETLKVPGRKGKRKYLNLNFDSSFVLQHTSKP